MNIHYQILKEFFNCDKCLNIMIDPISTKCGHKFCLKCLSVNNDYFFCTVCKIYLNKNDFYSNSEMKKTIKYLNESSKSKSKLQYSYLNCKESEKNKNWELTNNDQNFEMSNSKEKKEINYPTENLNSNLNFDSNLNSYSNSKFMKQSKYRIKRKNNEMDKCFRVECKYDNVENKLDEFMKTFSTTENEFLNLSQNGKNNYLGNNFKVSNFEYNHNTNSESNKLHNFEFFKQNTHCNYEIPDKKFKR
jgi:hypothetical protein